MTHSFIHLDYSETHPGVERFERVLDAASRMRQGFDRARGLAAGLLAAMVSALIVVAEQLIDTWAEGHLLAAWVLLWAVGFAALALLAPTARSLAARVMQSLNGWSQRVARRRADERLWDLAQRDARVMADIQSARSRAEAAISAPAAEPAASAAPAQRSMNPDTAARLARLNRRIWNE